MLGGSRLAIEVQRINDSMVKEVSLDSGVKSKTFEHMSKPKNVSFVKLDNGAKSTSNLHAWRLKLVRLDSRLKSCKLWFENEARGKNNEHNDVKFEMVGMW